MIAENFVQLLTDAIHANWTRPALSDYQGETLRYADVAGRIAWLHDLFDRLHVAPGEKVAVVGRNSANWAVTYLATITYGAVIVPILPDFTPENMQHIVNHSDSRLLFATDALAEKLDQAAMPNLDGIMSLDDWRVIAAGAGALEQTVPTAAPEPGESPETFSIPQPVPNDALATIMYTSGTTGFSKGVMLPHNSLAANVIFAQRNMPLTAGDTILSFLPLAHAYGCAFEFLFPFSKGCHITLFGKMPSPKLLLEAFSDVQPRLILMVPLLLEKIYRKRIQPLLKKPLMHAALQVPVVKALLLKKIRHNLMASFGGNFHEIIIGGAALDPEVERFLKRIEFPFTIGYGMTECGPLISYAPWNEHRPASVGVPINYLEVTIHSATPQQEVGHVLVRGENVMTGYYKNPEATRETLRDDGWLNTGDLGTIDPDGFIYIKGRSKNLILGPSGQNIYPEEIETQFNNLPFVQEALVLEENGRIFALVYPDQEAAEAAGLQKEDVRRKMEENRKLLNSRLPAYSAITKVGLYPEEFEKTPTRKIKRFLYNVSHLEA